MTPSLLDAIKPLLALAALAPSSHNSQPWRVEAMVLSAEASAVTDPLWPQALRIELDGERRLRALPSLQREMLISLGGFAAILLNLLHLSGWAVEARLLGPRALGVLLLLGQRAEPDRADAAGLALLSRALRQRQTERGPYRPEQPLHFACSQRLLPHSLQLGDAKLCWRLLDAPADRAALGAFYAQYAARDLLHREAWSETYAHLRFGADTALPPDTQGIAIERLFGPMGAWRRRSLQLLLHPAVVARLGRRGLVAQAGSQLQALINSSPALLYLCSSGTAGQPATLLQAGERVAGLWLLAASRGQALHPLSVALQHEDLRWRLAKLLACADDLLFIARAGTPARPLPAPRHRRRPPEAFCTHSAP